MKNLNWIALVVTLSLQSSPGFAQTCNFPPVEKLKVGSEISTFVYDFWAYSKDHFPTEFKKYPFIIAGEGPVVGDYHFNNVGIYFNDDKKVNAGDVAIIDMDDSGKANQFGDFLKLLLYIKSEFNESGEKLTEKALKYYVKGLEAKSEGPIVPEKLTEDLKELVALLNMDESKFDNLNQDFATDKMSNGKFKKSWGLEPLKKLNSSREADEKKVRKHVEKFGKIIDDGYRINESGSSIGAYRFVYLVQTAKATDEDPARYSIIEMKENNCPGTIKFADQGDQKARFNDNKSDLISKNYWKEASIIDLGDISYLLRVKKANPLEKIKKDGKHLEDFTAFFAYTLGRIHSDNANGEYINGLIKEAEEKAFVKTVVKFVESYDSSLAKRTKK